MFNSKPLPLAKGSTFGEDMRAVLKAASEHGGSMHQESLVEQLSRHLCSDLTQTLK